jgi:hypothetical protein
MRLFVISKPVGRIFGDRLFLNWSVALALTASPACFKTSGNWETDDDEMTNFAGNP